MLARYLILVIFLIQLGTSQYLTQQQRKTLVDSHNAIRSLEVDNYEFDTSQKITNMLKLKYDPRLEIVAQNYQDSHSSFSGHNLNRVSDYQEIGGTGSVGENWYSGDSDIAAERWCNHEWDPNCSERGYWYETSPHCTNGRNDFNNYGHFTQVVWANTAQLGCGLNPGTLCNYNFAGNSGEKPYDPPSIFKLGNSACSDCPDGYNWCVENLCTDVDPSFDCTCKDSPTGECVSNDVCSCYFGFTGDLCEDYDCSCYGATHGRCTYIDKCVCDSGYRGDGCDEFDCSCYGSAHGSCTDANVCQCDDNYEGDTCEDMIPTSDTNVAYTTTIVDTKPEQTDEDSPSDNTDTNDNPDDTNDNPTNDNPDTNDDPDTNDSDDISVEEEEEEFDSTETDGNDDQTGTGGSASGEDEVSVASAILLASYFLIVMQLL
eukprot:TRINITY_DN882_c0_g1_i4.p1 TRINITY_DN882_c0_g1~~TRINITY_DN882_c0_g1_i4.p1  ORF type:complete len:430 (+),score=102.19 TRINITY_DN882_c0_g1_i4:360-1649(+)